MTKKEFYPFYLRYMTNYFTLLLDLLDVSEEEKASFLGIGEIVAHHTNKNLIIHHRMRFIFEAWWEYLHDQISLEEFLATGDVSSHRPLWKKGAISSLEFLQGVLCGEREFVSESMILLDEVSLFSLLKEEQEKIITESERNQVLLLLC